MRRFHAANSMHPTYQAMEETGRVQRTIFACRYLRDRDLQREVGTGLNVGESWNAGNTVVYFGKGGDIPGRRRDEQELTVLCLRVLQASISYLNTLLIQDILTSGTIRLSAEDRRGITPLIWAHITPYGEVSVDLSRRLSLRGDTPAPSATRTSHDHNPCSYTAMFRDQHASLLAGAADSAAAAAAAGDWDQPAATAVRTGGASRHLQHSIIRDALAAGLDW